MNISKNVCTGSHCGQRFVWIQQYLPLEARSAWIQQRKCTFCADIPSCGGMPRNFVTNIGINRVRIGGSVPSVPSNAANTAPEQADDDEHEETSEELAKTKSLTSASSRRAALSCTNLPEKRGLQSLKLTQKSLHSKIVALKQKIDRRKRNFNNIQRSRKKIRPVGRSHLLGPAAEEGEEGDAVDAVDAVFSEDEANIVVEVNAEDEAAEEEAEEEEEQEEQEQQQAAEAEAEQAAEAAEAGGVDGVDEDLNLNGDLLLSEEHELFFDRTMARGANNMVVDSPVYQKTVACKLCGKQDLQSPCSFCNYLLLKYIQT